ncbi:MAG: hypothetical protein ACYC0M_10695 [Burkholderiales bacterium]
MDSHDICELVSGLASRANNLSVAITGDTSRTLLQQQDELSNLALATIAKDLDTTTTDFVNSISVLNQATAAADTAAKNLQQVTNAIDLIAKAISSVTNLLAA